MNLLQEPITDRSSFNQEERFAEAFASRRRILFLFAAALAFIWTILYLQFTVDDAFISFRYGKILVTHHVWNWNPSGPHQEAYTSALYTVLSVIPAFFHLSPAIFFKLIGLLCVGAMVVRLRSVSLTTFAVVLGVLLIGIDPLVWIHAYSGLETPLYMLLLLEMGLSVDRASVTSPYYVYALFLLLPLTRPEGVVYGIAGVAAYWFRRGEKSKQLGSFAGFLFLGIAYFLVRWRYFYQLLPNPFYVKAVHTSFHTIAANLGENKTYLFALVLVLVLGRRLSTRAFALCSLLLMLILFIPHAMQMNYADRYYFQIAFPVVLLFLITENVAPISRLACIVCILMLTTRGMRNAIIYFPYVQQSYVKLAKSLSPYAEDHTMLVGDAGAIPYYSDWVSYDFIGLCTSRITRNGLSVALLRELHPDLIFLYGIRSDSGFQVKSPAPELDRDQQVILDYIRQSGDYEFAGASQWRNYALIEFLRKDTSQRDKISKVLQENTERSEKAHLSIKYLLEQKYVPWSE